MRFLLPVVAVLCLGLGIHAVPSVQHLLKQSKQDADSQIWVLVVAGSNTWMNYRHQADACHAYQIFHAHGVPDSNIVVMMYDDIADNSQNPDKGVIINKKKGPNVYLDIVKDYTKEAVTPENFLKVLQGEKPGVGSGKVIASGPNDYVFVNFVDHGGVDIIAFPDGELTAKQLNKAISAMASGNKFKQMVVYVEACESGSMFADKLSTDINVYATTAANPDESSYACYYDSKLQTYLGDVYSVKWMENVDAVGTSSETLEQQYKIVKNETTTSHVMQYGTKSFVSEKLDVFMGTKNETKKYKTEVPLDAVPSGDVPVGILMHKIFDSPTEWAKREHEQALVKELQFREEIRQTVERIVTGVVGKDLKDTVLSKRVPPSDYDCYEAAVTKFSQECYKLGKVDYALRFMYAMANLCEHSGTTVTEILDSIEKEC